MKPVIKILIAEHDLHDVELIEHELKTGGVSYVSEVVQNEEGYCRALNDFIPDIIFSDYTFPSFNGATAFKLREKMAPDTPFIIISGTIGEENSIELIKNGVTDFVLKDKLYSLNIKLTRALKEAKELKQKNTAEKELRKSEKRYSDLFNFSPQPNWVFDAISFRFVQVNKATIDLYGYSEEEFLNMSLMDIKQKEDTGKVAEQVKKQGLAGEISNRAVLHHKKSGEVIEVEIYSNPIVINDKDLWSAIGIDVTEKNQHEHKITKAIIKTQDDERYEIGSELHDNVCQILAASRMSLGMFKDHIAPENIPAFDRAREYITLALDEIRNLSHRLAPAFFDGLSLKEAFEKLFKNFDPAGTYKIVLNFEDPKYPLHRDIQLNIYRILQEQLRNIFKYAYATVITVDISISDNKLKMTVSDNGVGFNAEAHSTGIGFANMKRRAESFSGTMQMNSMPGKGCTIIIEIPLAEPEFIPSSL